MKLVLKLRDETYLHRSWLPCAEFHFVLFIFHSWNYKALQCQSLLLNSLKFATICI